MKAYLEDFKTRNATERCLERISEAARKLGELGETLSPAFPWANLRAPGNFLRHDYDRVDPARVWMMIEDDLGPLKTAAQTALQQLGPAQE
jgi:uncharacterized protein with HEPN domain